MEKIFDVLQYLETLKVRLAMPMLKENVEFWWTTIKAAYGNNDDQLTWEEFKEIFYDRYFSETIRLVKENEFLILKQKTAILMSMPITPPWLESPPSQNANIPKGSPMYC